MRYRTGMMRGALVGAILAVAGAIYGFIDVYGTPPGEFGDWGGLDFAFTVAGMLLVLYGLPLIIVAAGIGALVVWRMRRRRRNRGLCPACAYPIGSSDTCTECGAAVQPGRDDGM